MPKYLRQPGFLYSACGPFTKNNRYINQNEIDKSCFQHDGDFKDLNRRTTAGKVLHDEALNIGKILKYDGYQRGLASMVYKFI